ncbi:TPA: carboxymuconolactone decarboxylase family protein [Neisseria gonorrhoeae]
MFKDWKEHTALVKKSFGELGKAHPKMLQAYGALEQAAAAKAGATDSEIAGALATAIALNAGAAYTYALRALEAVETQK